MKRFLKYDTEIVKKENSPVDKNGIIKENIVGGGSSVQPDWNQNDETAADYVKNRPFYTGYPVETVLVEESNVSFAENHGLYGAQVQSTFAPTVGETYKVYWDGAAYECTCVSFPDNMKLIGNPSIMGDTADTGEPFLIVKEDVETITIVTTDTSASHTFSICVFAPEVVKIDPKYIRDMYYTGDPVETVLVEESTVSFSFAENHGLYEAQIQSSFEATVGETYKVYWDGAAYECTCVKFNNNPAIGNLSIAGAGSDTGEPFLVGIFNVGRIDIATQNTSASHTFSISGFTQEVVKIDEKYLPDSIISDISTAQSTANTAQSTAANAQTTANDALATANTAKSTADTAKSTADTAKSTADTAKTAAENAQSTANTAKTAAENAQSKAESIKPNWNENNSSKPGYIANRPFYHDIITAELPFGKSQTPSAKLPIDGTELYWSGSVSNLTGLLQIDKNKIYMLDGTLEKFTPVWFRTGINSYSYDYALGNPHLIKAQLPDAKDAYGGELPDTGGDWVYYRTPGRSTVVTISKTNGWSGRFVEFLSEDLKLLDEKFIPASIQRTGGEVFIHSSTPNSTKKFKITVDDSGAISATEVS